MLLWPAPATNRLILERPLTAPGLYSLLPQVHGEQGPHRVHLDLQGGGGEGPAGELRLPLRVLHAGVRGAEELQPHADRRLGRQQGVRYCHAQGLKVER